MKNIAPSKTRINLTSGAIVRIAREMAEMSQDDLERKSKIPQSAISAIERGRVPVGLDRAKALGAALGIHPAVILFPELRDMEIAKLRKQA